ncbi:hypothetical protein EDD85DRAFT_797425 [Armillaria nabsnona]|nr:hypothetical protein EDD85DRAFT_797425 [Armillaria nabsnona]
MPRQTKQGVYTEGHGEHMWIRTTVHTSSQPRHPRLLLSEDVIIEKLNKETTVETTLNQKCQPEEGLQRTLTTYVQYRETRLNTLAHTDEHHQRLYLLLGFYDRVPRGKISLAAGSELDTQYAPALPVNVAQQKESERFLEGSSSSIGRTLQNYQHAFKSSHTSSGTPRPLNRCPQSKTFIRPGEEYVEPFDGGIEDENLQKRWKKDKREA